MSVFLNHDDLSVDDVRMVYDCLINSLDWGSGFLSTAESLALIKLGIALGAKLPACGWPRIPRVQGRLELCNLVSHHAGDHEYVVWDYSNPPQTKLAPLRTGVEE